MDTTETLLDALKIKLQLRSDYALAKYLGVTGVTMLRWRDGKGMSDENAIRVADLLSLPRAYVLACMGAQRAEDTESSGVWRQIADTFRATVSLWIAAIALILFISLAPAPAQGASFPAVNNIHYAKFRMRRASQKRRRNTGFPVFGMTPSFSA